MTKIEMQNFLVESFTTELADTALSSIHSIRSLKRIFDNLFPGAIGMDHGVEKLVVIFDKEDYVLKIPMLDTGCREWEVYKGAVMSGVSEFFAETFEPFAIPFKDGKLWMYFQKKVNTYSSFNCFDIEKNFTEEEVKIQALCREVSYQWSEISYGEAMLKDHRLYTIIPLLGAEKAKALLDFLVLYRVNDLWSANYSFSLEEGLVIFDFAGYESYDEAEYYGEYYDYDYNYDEEEEEEEE